MKASRSWILATAVGVGGVVTCAVVADVDLEWSPPARAALAGTVFEIDLYAVTDDGQDQTIAAIDVVLTWDPQRLLLLGVVDRGPYEWLSSGFDLPDPGELNESLLDGDAQYTALSALGAPAVATSDGLLVTTLRFFALSEVDATEIVIEESLSITAVTRVFAGDAPNNLVTGELGSVSVTIIRRPKVLRARSYTETSDP